MIINQVETQMGMQNLMNCFVLDVSMDQRSETVLLTIVKWLHNLCGSSMKKPWNDHSDYHHAKEERQKVTPISFEGYQIRLAIIELDNLPLSLG